MTLRGCLRLIFALGCALFGVACDSGQDIGAQTTRLRPDHPNIVFILTDDLSWNLVEHLPNVQALQRNGTTFERHFVTDSLCCPSRASILTGMYSHNTRVFANYGEDGGYTTFVREGHERRTFAVALQGGGYRTALLGKYLNLYEPSEHGPAPGWSDWAVGGKAYDSFDYDLNENGTVVHYGSRPEDYVTDVLSGIAQTFVGDQSLTPFFLMISSYAPHSPYVPAPRHGKLFPELRYPKTAAFDVAPEDRDPAWLRGLPPLSVHVTRNAKVIFTNRVRAMLSVDELIGDLQAMLKATGRDKDTYIFFTSDNGFHIGERRMIPGKQTAFDTDIRVPLIVTGPGVPAGAVERHVTQSIDLCSTFAELGGVEPPATANGRSLVPLLHGEHVRDWRNAALIEHEQQAYDTDDPDAVTAHDQNNTPPSYKALRTPASVYIEYVTGEVEFHDHTTDPDELHNTVEALSPEQRAKYHAAIEAISKCKTAAECWDAQHL